MLISYIFTFSLIVLSYIIYLATIRSIINKKHDRYYNINTRGLRDWDKKGLYNRTESTPYQALINLVDNYKVNKDSEMVDFGCGKGRVMIYLHYNLNIPVTGIEINDLTYAEAEENIERYLGTIGDNQKASIGITKEYAEDYIIKQEENIFFFFNPFSSEIFEKVIDNIVRSSNEFNKKVQVILYYPMIKYKKKLNQSSFKLVKAIRTKKAIDFNELFLIYEYVPNQKMIK